MTTTSVSLLDANGNPVTMAVIQLGSGLAATNVLCDGTGTPYGSANPLLTAPGIKPADFINCGGSVVTMGAVALDIPANAARKGGEFRANPGNTGVITLTFTNTGGTRVKTLQPGDSTTLTVSPGYVLQHDIKIAGTVVGDTWEGVEFI